MKIMVKNMQRKFTIGMLTEESMKEAVVMVINGDVSIRSAAERMSVAKSTLHEHVKKIKRTDSSEIDKKRKDNFDRIMHVVKFSTKIKK